MEMRSVLKIKFSPKELCFYLILVPFFFPRGFSEISPLYKDIATMLLLVSSMFILGKFFLDALTKKIKIAKSVVIILIYHIIFAIETIFVQGTITMGIQKLFVTPVFVMFFALYFADYTKEILNVIANILLVIFFLNDIIFSPFIFEQYFSMGGLTFIGHMQLSSQLGFLGVFIALLNNIYNSRNKKNIVLIILSLVVMALSKTSASAIGLIIFSVAVFAYKVGMFKTLFQLQGKYYVLGWIIVNLCLFIYSNNFFVLRDKLMALPIIGGFDFSFSGRTFIWTETMELINRSPFFGYGAYGVEIDVFWLQWVATEWALNYTHNDLLQHLLDGGFLLGVVFVCLLFLSLKNIRYIKNNNLKFWVNAILLVFLVISLSETVTEFYYFWGFLSIIIHLPKDIYVGKVQSADLVKTI